MNDIDYNEFIGFYKNVYPSGYCQHLINEFDRLEEGGVGANRQQSEKSPKHIKDDYQIGINIRNHSLLPFEEKDPVNIFFNGLQVCYENYIEKFSVVRDMGKIRATTMKMQRTGPGGGYHVWHCEHGPDQFSNRVLVYMLYLNSFSEGEGGETEFLYQRVRTIPEENMMIIWPASYTHTHRGNQVLVDKHKYVITGWFYLE